MKIEKLKVGAIYKNYKELCNALEEPIKTGGAKANQLDEWKYYFDWLRDGNKFIISDIKKRKEIKEEWEEIRVYEELKKEHEMKSCQITATPLSIDNNNNNIYIHREKNGSKMTTFEEVETQCYVKPNIIVGKLYPMSDLIRLCLNEEPKTGHSYKKQCSQVECRLRTEKINRKWMVQEVYDQPLEREDNKGGNFFDKNGDINEILLMYFWIILKESGKSVVAITIPKLDMFEILGLTNENFETLRYAHKELKEIGYDKADLLLDNIQTWMESKISTMYNQLVRKGALSAVQVNWRTIVLEHCEEHMDGTTGITTTAMRATEEQVQFLNFVEDMAIKIWNREVTGGNRKSIRLDGMRDIARLKDSEREEFFILVNRMARSSDVLPSNYRTSYRSYSFLTNVIKLERALYKFGINPKNLTVPEMKALMDNKIREVNSKHCAIQMERLFNTLIKAQQKEREQAEYLKNRRVIGKAPKVEDNKSKIENYVLQEKENMMNLVNLVLDKNHVTSAQENRAKMKACMNRRGGKKRSVVVETRNFSLRDFQSEIEI